MAQASDFSGIAVWILGGLAAASLPIGIVGGLLARRFLGKGTGLAFGAWLALVAFTTAATVFSGRLAYSNAVLLGVGSLVLAAYTALRAPPEVRRKLLRWLAPPTVVLVALAVYGGHRQEIARRNWDQSHVPHPELQRLSEAALFERLAKAKDLEVGHLAKALLKNGAVAVTAERAAMLAQTLDRDTYGGFDPVVELLLASPEGVAELERLLRSGSRRTKAELAEALYQKTGEAKLYASYDDVLNVLGPHLGDDAQKRLRKKAGPPCYLSDLASPSAPTRAATARCHVKPSLGRLDHVRAAFVAMLGDPDPAVREVVDRALVDQGLQAILPVIDACVGVTRRPSAGAMRFFFAHAGAALPPLGRFFLDRIGAEVPQRRQGLRCLIAQRARFDEAAWSQLKELGTTKDGEVQQLVRQALATCTRL